MQGHHPDAEPVRLVTPVENRAHVLFSFLHGTLSNHACVAPVWRVFSCIACSYDVAVSQYQSFTKNHAIPAAWTQEAKDAELAKRAVLRADGPDKYAKRCDRARSTS